MSRLCENLPDVAATYGNSALLARVGELYGIAGWNTTPQRRLRLDTANDAEAYVTDFALLPDALLLFHHVGMAHYNFESTPEEASVFLSGAYSHCCRH